MRNIKAFEQFNDNTNTDRAESIISELIAMGYTRKMSTEMVNRYDSIIDETHAVSEIAKSIEEAEFENDNFEE